ncbi:MAG: tetratricopeptide repeat protein, partial [Gammaproteobacteria bacterium]
MGYAYYYGSRDYAAALDQFKRAREQLPDDADVITAIAAIRRRQGKWHAALAGFRRVRELDPRNPRRCYTIGTTLSALRH